MKVPGLVAVLILAALNFAASCQAADTLAVLPLFNVNEAKSPNLDWIGESAAETIREALSGSGLLVLSREEREEVYKRLSLRTGVVLTKASVMKIGVTLDATRVVFGEFRVNGAESGSTNAKSSLHLSLHVIELRKPHEGPELTEDGPLEDLSQMETRLAWMLLRQLTPATTPAEEDFTRDRPPVRVEAMESYIRGLMATGAEQKMKLFTQAATLDAHFSQPNFQLGRMMFAKKDYRGAQTAFAKVTKADSHYLESVFLRGICRFHTGDYEGAAAEFRTVAAEVPLNEVYNNLGAALSRRGDPAAAENFSKAVEGDAGDPDYWFNLGYSLWRQGQFQPAAEKFRAVLERVPGDAESTTLLGRCLKAEGPKAGEAGRERIKTTFEDSAWRQLQAELRN